MNDTYVIAQKDTGNDSLSIQNAINIAKETESGTVVIGGGQWNVNTCIYVHNNIRLIFDGAIVNVNTQDGYFIRNSNAIENYKNVLYAEQNHIVIKGENGAIINNGTVFLSNVSYSVIDGLKFVGSKNFAIITASTLGLKIKNIQFDDCENGILLAVGTRDCIYHDLSGNVKNNFFVLSEYAFEEFRRHHREYVVINNLIRSVSAVAENLVYCTGQDIERIVFSDISATVKNVAFNIKKGKCISVSNANIVGKLFNDDIDENTLIFVK